MVCILGTVASSNSDLSPSIHKVSRASTIVTAKPPLQHKLLMPYLCTSTAPGLLACLCQWLELICHSNHSLGEPSAAARLFRKRTFCKLPNCAASLASPPVRMCISSQRTRCRYCDLTPSRISGEAWQ